jgi:VanZ family protein
LFTAGLVLAVALSDEFHQSFVASRTGALADVGFDFIGGIMGLFLMLRMRNGTRALYSHSVL